MLTITILRLILKLKEYIRHYVVFSRNRNSASRLSAVFAYMFPFSNRECH